MQALRFRLATRQLGDAVDLTVFRRGARVIKQLELVPPPDVPARNVTELDGRHPLLGARVANLNPALAAELGIETDGSGVMILAIHRNRRRRDTDSSRAMSYSRSPAVKFLMFTFWTGWSASPTKVGI